MLMRMANELFKLCCRAMKKGAAVKYRLSSVGVFCRVEINGEIYELYQNRELSQNTLINYWQCREKLEEIVKP